MCHIFNMEREIIIQQLAALIVEDSKKTIASPFYEPYRYVGENLISEAIAKINEMGRKEE